MEPSALPTEDFGTRATDDVTQGASISLVERARRGDRAAFTAMVETRLVPAFRTAAAILGNAADADDVVQESFLKAWQYLPGLRDPSRFDAWFNRLLRNRCRDRLRTRRRSREIELTDEADVAFDAIGSIGETAALSAAFDRLRVADRQLLVLHHLHRQPLSAISQQLGIPVGTVKSRLHAARRALVRALEDRS